jgi:transglutaminase-like putative cysteine protease
MSAAAHAVRIPRAASPPLIRTLAAFAALAGFAALRYARLLTGAPAGRVAAVVALATACGAAVAVTAAIRSRTLATTLRLLAVAACGYAAVRAVGVPARLESPKHWGELIHDLRHGFNALGGGLWPYDGRDRWARLTVLLALPAMLVPAAALAFWPAGRSAPSLRITALALLLTVYITGIVNQPSDAWALDGVLLLAVLAAWIWLPSARAGDGRGGALWLTACASVALVLAGGLRGGGPWFDYQAWNVFGLGELRTAFQWDQLYGPITWSRTRELQFEVSAPAPQLWKVTTLDRFDGVRFLRSGARLGAADYRLRGPVDPRWSEQATITLRGLRSDLLVGAGQIVGVTMQRISEPESTAYQPDGTTRLLGPPLGSGDTYTVSVYVPAPSAAQLRRSPRRFPDAYLPYTAFDLPAPGQSGLAPTDLSSASRAPFVGPRTVGSFVPGHKDASAEQRILASPYGRTYRLAQQLAAGAGTTYDVATRFQRYLRSHYVYSERPPRHRYPLDAFLFEDGAGYCQQFSAAMTLMLRMRGVPARVATGFLPGEYDAATKRYRVRAVDAHSWVEVYFDHIGWVPFDPTPPRTPLPLSRAGDVVRPERGVATSLATIGARPVVRKPERFVPAQPAGGSATQAWLIAGGLLGALVALLAAVWLAGARRLRRALSGDLAGAVAELRPALERLGLTVPPGTTLAELERRLERLGGPAAGRYMRLLRERRFGATGEGPDAADRGALRRALTANGGAGRWLSGLLAFPPGAARR